jgi:hypothetical protein
MVGKSYAKEITENMSKTYVKIIFQEKEVEKV